ncbi:MAG: hypothetical protein K9W45_08305 [Candidatus Heimdallarchaeum aukensis]|uniref:Uncharacterized protein n=1 Tax=Candidatus Heimdallarchaeum aukensis TaxID=2876573 RepID=A0A9Y1FKH4_9ARCH|nr:MAG: hypothetical protein K9W45_08305 [Candidatus Heimdallarchaeum aukensis]
MSRARAKNLAFFLIVISLFLSLTIPVDAYDKKLGIEWGDRVEVACERYIDGKLKTVYSEDYPLEVAIDEDITNYNFVSELVGMKVGETKSSISWYVTQTNGSVSYFEYKNVKILRITLDATPDHTGPSAGNVLLIILKVILGLGLAFVLLYLIYKLWKRFLIKKCFKCRKNKAIKKCSKCGIFLCDKCTINGCPECKSRTFVRL